MLYKWGKRNTPACEICGDTDTIQHALVDCPNVNHFWKSIKWWFKSYFNTNIKFAALDILLGIPNPEKDTVVNTLNFLFLFGKSFIKQRRIESLMVHFYEFQVKLKNRLFIEKEILLSNGNIELYELQWKPLHECM